MKRAKEAVIGLGNYLLADEAAGLHAVHLLEQKFKNEEVDIVAGGTPGLSLLHQFDGRKKIIFIDAGNCGLQPGQYIRFRPDEVQSRKKNERFSLHEFDLITFLRFARSFHENRKIEIVIYCIQPGEVKFAEELSPMVKQALPLLVQKVYNEIAADINRE